MLWVGQDLQVVAADVAGSYVDEEGRLFIERNDGVQISIAGLPLARIRAIEDALACVGVECDLFGCHVLAPLNLSLRVVRGCVC